MNSPNLPSLFDSSRLVLDQPYTPSLREILGAYKFSKGQDGDCQLLIAVLNAKSAEDERLAAIAKLHSTMLEFEYGTSPSSSSYSSPRQRSSSPLYPERRMNDSDRKSRRRDRSRRNPYERSLSPYPTESTTSSPRAREPMSIGTLLSNDEDNSRNRRPASSPSSG